MNVEFIKCNLVDIKSLDRGSYFALQRKDNKEIVSICVDESKERIFSRMQDVLNGERENIYLSRCMTNIDISTSKNYDWSINEETGKYYEFNQSDVEELAKDNKFARFLDKDRITTANLDVDFELSYENKKSK